MRVEFSWVLEQNIPTFNRANLATVQLNQKLIQPDVKRLAKGSAMLFSHFFPNSKAGSCRGHLHLASLQ